LLQPSAALQLAISLARLLPRPPGEIAKPYSIICPLVVLRMDTLRNTNPQRKQGTSSGCTPIPARRSRQRASSPRAPFTGRLSASLDVDRQHVTAAAAQRRNHLAGRRQPPEKSNRKNARKPRSADIAGREASPLIGSDSIPITVHPKNLGRIRRCLCVAQRISVKARVLLQTLLNRFYSFRKPR
jgi:hypothetical protein